MKIAKDVMDGSYYIVRRTAKRVYRDWFLVKNSSLGTCGVISLRQLSLPIEFIGKKVKLKVVVIE
ncbi:MAG: hypothetical protein ACTSSP_11080 [Candidatus Asgardarchaeia archaeon]